MMNWTICSTWLLYLFNNSAKKIKTNIKLKGLAVRKLWPCQEEKKVRKGLKRYQTWGPPDRLRAMVKNFQHPVPTSSVIFVTTLSLFWIIINTVLMSRYCMHKEDKAKPREWLGGWRNQLVSVHSLCFAPNKEEKNFLIGKKIKNKKHVLGIVIEEVNGGLSFAISFDLWVSLTKLKRVC